MKFTALNLAIAGTAAASAYFWWVGDDYTGIVLLGLCAVGCFCGYWLSKQGT